MVLGFKSQQTGRIWSIVAVPFKMNLPSKFASTFTILILNNTCLDTFSPEVLWTGQNDIIQEVIRLCGSIQKSISIQRVSSMTIILLKFQFQADSQGDTLL